MKLQKLFRELQIALQEKQNEENPSHCYTNNEFEGRSILSDFMQVAGEPITWVEAIELWHNMRKTNISKMPTLNESLHTSIHLHKTPLLLGDPFPISLNGDSTTTDNTIPLSEDMKEDGDLQQQGDTTRKQVEGDKSPEQRLQLVTRSSSNDVEDDKNVELPSIVHELPPNDIVKVAKSIKETYGIRLSDDDSEFKFILGSQLFLWSVVIILLIVGHFHPSKSLGSLTWKVLIEAFVMFIAELLWECVLSAIDLRYNIKINYKKARKSF